MRVDQTLFAGDLRGHADATLVYDKVNRSGWWIPESILRASSKYAGVVATRVGDRVSGDPRGMCDRI